MTRIEMGKYTMRALIIILIFFTATATAQVQLMKPVFCDSTTLILGALAEQGGELPTWLGQGDGEDKSKTTLLINPKTKTWTIVQFEKDRACVLGSGVGSRPIFTGPNI